MTPQTTAFGITADEFKNARLHAAWTVETAADRLKVTRRTVRNWESGARRVPYFAYELLRILGCHNLPGPAWQGWRIVDDTLYSPEGLGFKAVDIGWWGLTCAMARCWLERQKASCDPLPADIALLFEMQCHGRAAQAVGEGHPAPGGPPSGGRPVLGDADSPAHEKAAGLERVLNSPALARAGLSNNPHKVSQVTLCVGGDF